MKSSTTIPCKLPYGDEACCTAFQEIEFYPGDQYTILPDTRHRFQAVDEGAVISEFSSFSMDVEDIFTDPGIVRVRTD